MYGTNTNRLTIDTSGNVGIGTVSPSTQLDVYHSTAPRMSLSFAGGSGNGGAIDFNLINGGVSQPITLQIKGIDDGAYRQHMTFSTKLAATGASALEERMRITSAGKIEIATTGYTLSDGQMQLGRVSMIQQDINSMYVGTNFNGSTTGNYEITQYATQIHHDSSTGNINFKTAPSGTLGTNIPWIFAMVIKPTGNVGIGTSSPTHKLHVYSAAPTGGIGLKVESGNATNWIQNKCTAGSWQIGSTGSGFQLYNDDTASYRFTVQNGGNVGIGVTAPAAKLHVKGGDFSLEESGGNGNKIFLTTDHAAHYINANAYWVDVIGNQHEVFRVFGGSGGATEFMRVEGSGYTKLTDDGDTTWQGYNFHAITQSAASQPTVMIYNDNAGGNNYGINVIHRSTSANTTGRFFLGATNNGGTENIKIYTNGNIQNTNNSYTQLSDSRLKENIVDATSKLEEIKRLRVVNWNFIGDDLKQIGMVAQEVEEIFPGLVDVTGDNQIIHGTTYENVKSLKYSVLVPILVKAIQELEARVTELENN